MNCTFTIADDDGKRVTSIPPGTYQISVHHGRRLRAVDLSGIDDFTACKGFTQFQLSGPGVNIFTTLQDGDEDKDSLKETFAANATYTARDLPAGRRHGRLHHDRREHHAGSAGEPLRARTRTRASRRPAWTRSARR